MQKHYKNVKLLSSFDASGFLVGDIIVADGKISQIGKNLSSKCDEVIDLQGKIVLPAFKNLSCDLRGLSSSECEKVILSNISSGVTEIIAITDNLILLRYLFNKHSITYKIACQFDGIESDKDLICFANPTCDEENVLDDISDFAAKNNKKVFIDLFGNLQSTGELNSSTGQLPIHYVESFGLLDRGGYLSGAICSDKEDYNLLSQYDFTIVTRPISDLRKGNGFANIVQIQNAGLDLAFGSGEEMWIDFFQIGRAVLLGTRGLLCDEEAVSEKDVLMKMCRFDGVKEGQEADLIVLDGEGFIEPKDILNRATKRDIAFTIAKGNIIYDREVKYEN